MKSDGLGSANKPGDGHTSKAKAVKKPGDRSVAPKAKAASAAAPVVNGTAATGARRDVASASGPRSSHGSKDQEKKPNPGARPKTSPPSCTSTAVSRAPKSSVVKTDSSAGTTQAQPSASSTSGSASPENGASSPRKDTHPVPGLPSLLIPSHFIIVTGTSFSVGHHCWQADSKHKTVAGI